MWGFCCKYCYEIYTGPYAGTGSSNDTYLELYSDSELTNRIAFNDDGGESYFSSITANLSKDSTYYIKLRPYKGIANTLPEVVADLHWVIDDTVTAEGEYNQQVRFTDINGEEYLRRTLPVEIINRYYYNNIQYMWMTNISPTNDENGKLYSSETDMLGFTYKDHETGVEWVFDVDNDDGRGKPCNLGNWGVTNTYNITVTNNGEADRKLSFVTRGTGGGGGIFIYDLNDGTGQKVKWKSEYVGMESVTEPGVLSDDVSDSEIKSYEFYSNYYKDLLDIEVLETEPTITNKAKAAVEVCEFTVPAKNTKNIQIKFVFPNAYSTAFKNFMVVKE